MKLLLDTHALYWYVEGDPKLSTAAQAVIQDMTAVIGQPRSPRPIPTPQALRSTARGCRPYVGYPGNSPPSRVSIL
ncbi:MAG: hypothetical protein JSS02_03285 [Planctomycetes bacterium]|nr:hypothetical protein [Planctomycetota bacterium]